MRQTALALICLAAPAAAGDFRPPQGCTATLTVQSRGCSVEHIWTCEGEEQGLQWRGELDDQGLTYVGQIDAETQWLQSYFPLSGARELLVLPAADPASFSTLMETGEDTYDFTLDTLEGPQRVVGFDRLDERGVVIDGETLDRTAYAVRKTDAAGGLIYAAEGFEYVSKEFGRFFSGAGTISGPTGPDYDYDSRPVKFIRPGEPGFLSDRPLYGCAAQEARFEPEQKD